eukprot:TRINITY_DN49215_c0_g1_i2.p1 TRINITY_DN49215_c0_g1~~TRINITY_DN49215_c0_g1_i2.p1  ORF type:complete len:422 (+),score=105.62 TRINITY_DN49215_c0_g1_i2:199-1464(+)
MPIIVSAVSAGAHSTTNEVGEEHNSDINRLKNVTTGVWSRHHADTMPDEPLPPPPNPSSTPTEKPQDNTDTEPAALGHVDLDLKPEEGPDDPEQEQEQVQEEQDPEDLKSFLYLEGPETPKQWLFLTFDEPNFSRFSYGVSVGILTCIAISIIAIVIETLPDLRDNNDAGKVFIAIEWTSSIVFTIEYLCKLLAVEGKCQFARHPMNIIDLVAILPFYVELICSAAGVSVDIGILRLLRVVRIFRVFKLSKYSTNIQLCATVMIESRDSLGLMVFMLSIVAIVFSSFEFFCEKGTWDDEKGYYIDDNGNRSRFDSIPATMWWCVVTVMTVGYGDLYPITVPGKLVAAGAMVCAIVIMALPISVVGSNFSRAWSEAKANEEKRTCLLYTSDAADEEDSVDLGGRRIIKKKKKSSRIIKVEIE